MSTLSMDVVQFILSFLGKEMYLNKTTNRLHVRFIQKYWHEKLSFLFENINSEFKSFYYLHDTFEINIKTRNHSVEYTNSVIFFNEIMRYPGVIPLFDRNRINNLNSNDYYVMEFYCGTYSKIITRRICYHYDYSVLKKKNPEPDPLVRTHRLYELL